MKKIKKKYHLLVSSLLTTMMGFLGISCVFPNMYGPVMYGPAVPEDYLEIDGEVTNEAGEPLESMQVVINTSRISLSDTVYTNASGEFERAYGFPQKGNDTLLIEVKDTSNVYASEKVQIPFSEMTKVNESEYATEYSVDVKLQLTKK